MATSAKTFVVEHLDPELEQWSSLEYAAIASECHASGAKFLLSSVPTSLQLPENLKQADGLHVETRGIEEIYADKKDPEDGDNFDIFLFGGILGKSTPARVDMVLF
jgi:ribosome biogenesis SPOUT family RNA methylase Rps3